MSSANTISASRWLGRLAIAPRLAARLAAWGAPARSLVFGPLSLGDDLLCTAVLREARRREQPVVMFTARPELFVGNTDPVAVHSIDDHYMALLRRLGRRVYSPYYVSSDLACPDRDKVPTRHVIAEMCRLCGFHGEVTLRPYLHLTPAELTSAPRLPRQVSIHSSGLAAAIPYRTKEWGADRFTSLARLLSDDFSLVQIGSPRDPVLPGVALDLRGRTTLREAAAIQANSLLFVGLEGFLAHLARAVDCPSVIVHGGRAAPHAFGYSANINLHATPPCSPCGLRESCPNDLACLAAITPEHVVEAVNRLAIRPRVPLPIETAHLD